MQLTDSKNVQCNLEIAQIPKLRRTYNDRIRGNGRLGRSVTVTISVCTADSGLLVVSQVFETFGPVKKPYYSIRVNSPDHVTSLGLTPNTVVYVVAGNLEMTRFVFMKKLMR